MFKTLFVGINYNYLYLSKHLNQNNMTIDLEVQVPTTCEVTFNVTGKYVKGRMHMSNGDPGHEDEYPELEVIECLVNGADVWGDLTVQEQERVEEYCWEAHNEAINGL